MIYFSIESNLWSAIVGLNLTLSTALSYFELYFNCINTEKTGWLEQRNVWLLSNEFGWSNKTFVVLTKIWLAKQKILVGWIATKSFVVL